MPSGIYQHRKGYKMSPFTETHLKNMSLALLGNKRTLGKKLSEDHKKKIGLSHKGIKTCLGKHHSAETKTKISLSLKNNSNCLGKKKLPMSEITKQKLREATIRYRVSGKVKNKETSIELAMENELKRRNIYYEKQVPLCKVCISDFYLPQYRAVIFCDGTYWHSRKVNKGRDIAQDTVLTFNGFNVYRFSETEINKSAEKCLDKISELFT
jgi:very-short-patch-repair endonuclease